MKPISGVVSSLPRSGIRQLMTLASRIENVIHLEVGEPSFNTPAHVIDAALEDARAGHTKYTPNAGFPSLREAIAERRSSMNSMTVSPDNVVVTTGAVGALAATVLTLVEDGDEVLLPDPGWPNYRSMVALARGEPVYYDLPAATGFVPDLEQVSSRITEATKAILINNPSNPTGIVLSRETLAGLTDLARQHDLYIIADEVYEDFTFDGEHYPASVFDPERVVTVSACSKTYAMTGWRLGYVVAQDPIVPHLTALQEPLVSCASSVSQRAAEAALRGPQDCVDEMREAYRRRRDLVSEILGPVGLLAARPTGAFYAMVDLRAGWDEAEDPAFTLLREEKVATAPGSTFGSCSAGKNTLRGVGAWATAEGKASG
jgi:aspartate/methionine/tyrosine aminotransferase